MIDESFDYVVVGAGSAGCVLAARLSEDPSVRILLVEAGGTNKHWTVDMPLAMPFAIASKKLNWHYSTEPEPHLGGRRIDHPRGRALGGSSSINGMVYSRGHALDYDGWAERDGCTGWSYAEVLPYFKRSEAYQGGENAYRGGAGPLRVTIPKLSDCVLNEAFIESGRSAGYPVTQDANGFQQEGFGANECTIGEGRRFGVARAFLEPARRRQNLTVVTDALVTRIRVESGRVTGIDYEIGGEKKTALAAREVIVSAGAFGTPHLLMLSGIGPAEKLREWGVPLVHAAPGVGRNLQDHPDLALQQYARRATSLYGTTKGLRKIRTGIEWFAFKKGIAASNQFHAGAFLRSRAGVKQPDMKLELIPLAYREDLSVVPSDAFQVHMTLMRPKSRGFVDLASIDPHVKPRVQFNYLSAAADIEVMRDTVRLVREVLAQGPMAQFALDEISPGSEVRSDAELDEWIRRTVATAYHPSGSCRMGGPRDKEAVCDPDLRVRGLDGLRVVDASVMPLVTSSNTNAPTIMIAEKASDMIRGRAPLSPIDAPVFINPHYADSQR